MDPLKGFFGYVWNFIVFCPVFVLLFLLGLIKVMIFGPVVFVIVTVGLSGVTIALWPMHVSWTLYCIAKTKKYGVMLKIVMLFGLLVPLLVWPVFGLIGSVLVGLGYGVISSLMATFEAVGEGVENKFKKCFVDGTWSSVLGGCTIVRDFSDVCFHSYFSFMDGLLESKSESPIEIKLSQIPGCALAAMLGILIDVPAITFLVAYKAPIMLFKGWHRLVQDLIGRRGPFLETVCVPFAGLSILLWPLVVALASFVGILSSVFLGLYAVVVAYQENSTKYGLAYIISVISMFDEYTNDLLYLREGSCFPRLRHRKVDRSTTGSLPVKLLPDQSVTGHAKRQPTKTPSMKMQELKAVMIWQNFFKACETIGKTLVQVGAIQASDLQEWQYSKNKIVNVGLPAYAFLMCFLRSIEKGSTGFVMRDNVELTRINRPEGRAFDWFFEPMTIMKEQLKTANLNETEVAYLYKITLYCGNSERIEAWNNNGTPPSDEVRKAQLVAISRRLQGFSLSLSRLPTFRRYYHEVVKALQQEAQQKQNRGTNGIAECV